MKDETIRYDNVHILLADADADAPARLRDLLSRAEIGTFELDAYSTFDTALDAALSGRYDFCLVGEEIDGRTGPELTRHLRERGSRLPVLLIVGQDNARLSVEARESDVDDCLPKEALSPELLRAAIRRIIARKQQLIEERRHGFDSVFSASGEGMVVLDPEGTILDVNTPFARITGYSRDELRGRSVFDFVSPDRAKVVAERFRRVVQTQTRHVHKDVQVRRRDGRYRWLSISSSLVRDEDGEPAYIVSFVKDVTDERRIQEHVRQLNAELARRMAELRQVLSSANCLLWHATVVRESDGTLVWDLSVIDEEAAQRFLPLDVPPDETYALFWYKSRLDEDRLGTDDRARDAILAGEPGYRQEFRVVDANGEMHWLFEDVTIQTVKHGEEWYLTGVCTDITELKRAEERHRLLLNALPDMIFRVRKDGVILDFVPGEGVEPCMPPEEFLGDKVHRFLPRALGTRMRQVLREAFKTREMQTLEFSQPLNDETHHFESRWIPYADDEVLVVVRDITARKEADERVRRAGERAQTYLDVAATILLALDRDGRVTMMNRKGYEVLGYEEGRVLDKVWFDFFVPESIRESVRSRFRQFMEDEIEPATYEYPVLTRTGEERIVRWHTTILRDDEGVPTGTLCSGEDVTEQRRAEEALRESEAFSRLIADSVPAAIAYVDRNQHYRFVNRTYAEWFDLTSDEAIGRHLRDVLGERNYARIQPRVERALRGERLEFETDIRTGATGERRHVRATYIPDREDDGSVAGFIAVVLDVTQQKQIENEIRSLNAELERRVEERTRELEAAKEEAERASQAKSEFLSRMSHELRTPLNSILGFAQLLELDVEPGTPEHESVEQIVKGGRHLLNLIEEILDLARIETGRLSLSPETFPIADAIAEAVAIMEPLAAQHQVRIIDYISDQPYRVHADRTRLQQILINLMSNAIKYNYVGGAVTLTAEVTAEGMLRVDVTDTGPGIPYELQHRLFEPFERLGADETEVEGTGIGLVVSRQLIEKMGGSIGFKSTPGEGSSFWIDIPMAGPEEEEETVIEPGVDTIRYTVLYIEDNADNVRLVERILARRGDVQLLVAPRASIGINLARAHRPNLILMDINLPGMDGFEALEVLKASPETEAIPVIALSARVMPHDIERGLAAGFRRYLTKPIDVNMLLEVLEEYLETAEADGQDDGDGS